MARGRALPLALREGPLAMLAHIVRAATWERAALGSGWWEDP